ncbi:unnamed protein product [Urochloa humidicola]
MGYPAPASPSAKGAPPPSPSSPHQLAQGAAPSKTPAAAPPAAASSSPATSAASPATSSSATMSAASPASSSPSSATSSASTPASSTPSATTAAASPASSSYSATSAAAALAKEVENELLVPDALVPEAAAGKGFVAHPARTAAPRVDSKDPIPARNFLADIAVADNELFHYELPHAAIPKAEESEVVDSEIHVPKLSSNELWCHLDQFFHELAGAVNPELKSRRTLSEKKKSRQTRKKVFSELVKLHGACLQKLPVNDETEGSIPFRSENTEKKDQQSNAIFTMRKILKRMFSRLSRKLKKIGGKMIQNEKHSDNKFTQEFGTMVCSELMFGAASVLCSPQMKCQDFGREKTFTPSVGKYNIITKMWDFGTLTEAEIGASLELLRHENQMHFKVASQHSSATFANQHLPLLNDPVPPRGQ